jgi:hypothetical protein
VDERLKMADFASFPSHILDELAPTVDAQGIHSPSFGGVSHVAGAGPGHIFKLFAIIALRQNHRTVADLIESLVPRVVRIGGADNFDIL